MTRPALGRHSRVRLLDLLIAAGAALRLSRLVTTDKLGEWFVVGPARTAAFRREREALAVERDVHPIRVEPADVVESMHSGAPRTAAARIVQGLECPFCLGFWAALVVTASLAVVAARPSLRPAWRVIMGALGLNYAAAHISARLDF